MLCRRVLRVAGAAFDDCAWFSVFLLFVVLLVSHLSLVLSFVVSCLVFVLSLFECSCVFILLCPVLLCCFFSMLGLDVVLVGVCREGCRSLP